VLSWGSAAANFARISATGSSAAITREPVSSRRRVNLRVPWPAAKAGCVAQPGVHFGREIGAAAATLVRGAGRAARFSRVMYGASRGLVTSAFSGRWVRERA
jgi:hypothetical protein